MELAVILEADPWVYFYLFPTYLCTVADYLFVIIGWINVSELTRDRQTATTNAASKNQYER